MKRTFAILLAVLMLIGILAACGGSANDPNLGVYKLSGAMGYNLTEFAELMELSEEEVAEMLVIELKSGGTVEISFDGETESGKWSLDGETLTLSDSSDETITGTLKDGEMVIEIDGESMTLTKAE